MFWRRAWYQNNAINTGNTDSFVIADIGEVYQEVSICDGEKQKRTRTEKERGCQRKVLFWKKNSYIEE